MKRYYTKPKGPRKTYESDDAFMMMKVFIPKGTHNILRDKHEATGLAMSRLVAIALDNELDSPMPFNYPCESPDGPYVEYAYSEQAGALLRFLERFPRGTQKETVMLCRRDIGIPSRGEIMGAYRELMEQELIEEFENKQAPSIVYVRVRGLSAAQLHEKKFRRIEGKSTRGERAITDEDLE